RLELHSRDENHPALQGGPARTGPRPELLQQTWSPSTRLLLGVAGGLLALRVLRRGRVAGLAVGPPGAGPAPPGIGQLMAEAEGQGRATGPGAPVGDFGPPFGRTDLGRIGWSIAGTGPAMGGTGPAARGGPDPDISGAV